MYQFYVLDIDEDFLNLSPKAFVDLLKKMNGSENIYAYTGNAIILADKDKILQTINITDVSRLSMDNITIEEIKTYLSNNDYLSFCGGISIMYSNFLHLKEGRLSTAKGLTMEYVTEMLNNLY